MTRIFYLSLLLLCSTFGGLQAQTTIDSIIAIVDEDVVTARELEARIALVSLDFAQSRRTLPDPETLQRQVLEIMISDSILLQEARRRGLKITDGQLNQALQSIARENRMDLTDFRAALIAQGLDYGKYRDSIRKEMTLNALKRQYSSRAATVTEAEVEDFIQRSGGDGAQYEYRLAHILIALPDAASPDQVNAAQQTASQLLARLDQGEAFDQLANEFSSGSSALQGGDLGWRKKAEIPGLFTTTVLNLKPGEYAGPLRSPSGLHIVSLIERRNLEQVLTRQTRSRHILMKSNELVSEDEVEKRLNELRARILAGEDFARLANQYSVDYNSGAQGGDIGWTDPGASVSEYETVANRLEPGQLSEPFRSQFGWHILEVMERRTIDETAQSRLKKIQAQLLQQKQLEAFEIWKQRLRNEAYVILPSA